MIPDDIRREAIRLYDAFTHTHLDRRQLMDGLVRLTGSAAAASGLLALIAADAAAAPIVPENDPRLVIREGVQKLVATGRELKLYAVRQTGEAKLPAVIVLHENRGLNAHIKDVARRMALEGFSVVAPDCLTISGGTPADEDAARKAISALDRPAVVQDVWQLARELKLRGAKVGAVGFCWGGGMVNSVAIAAQEDLDAGVVYYGPAPADLTTVPRIKADLLIHLAGDDERVNAGYPAYEAALKAAGVRYKTHVYKGAQHAFNNETSAERYNEKAAEKAWERTVSFFRKQLK